MSTEAVQSKSRHQKSHQNQPEAKEKSQDTSARSSTDSQIQPHPNYIKFGFAKSSQALKAGKVQFEKLNRNQRLGLIAAALMLFFWPLFGLVMFSPWLLGAFVVAYSFMFGFPAFVADLEEAVVLETNISEQKAEYVKEISKNLRTNWNSGAKVVHQLFEQGKKHGIALFSVASEVTLKFVNQALDKGVAFARSLSESQQQAASTSKASEQRSN